MKQRLGSAARVLTIQRDITRESHHPARERETEEFLLSHPFHLPGEVGNEGNVCQRLMIAHNHVGSSGIPHRVSGDVQLEERIDFGHGHPESSEPATCAVVDRVSVGEADEKEEREPADDQDDDRNPDPGGPHDILCVLGGTLTHVIDLQVEGSCSCNLQTVDW